MTINSVTAVLFTWQALKLTWQQRISDHQSDSLLPMHWKTISLNSAKTLLISHYKWNTWSLCCENHSIAESIVVSLQLRSSIYIFTDSLFFFYVYSHSSALVFIEPFPNFFPWGLLIQMAGYNQEFHSWLIAVGFAFSFGQHESVGSSLTFRVLASSWGRLISEEIR